MTNQQGAPEAMRLAEEITELMCSNEAAARRIAAAADELCRLHYENQRLAALAEAQQPAPSAASKAVLAAIRAANMQLVRTGDDEFMLVTYKNAKAQCDGGKCGIGGYCDDCPTPQADSQPAMTPETVYAAIAHGDEEHRAWLLSALRAVWCGEAVPPVTSPIANAAAESQPAPVLDYPPLPEQVAWRDSVEHCDLYWRPAVQEQNDLEPLFTKQQMRAYADETYALRIGAGCAARAPEGSVTAPAGGAVAGSGWKWVPKILSDEMVDAWASARLPGGISQMTDNEANRAVAQANWDAMIAAAPTPPAQTADSVLEDAARWQMAVLVGNEVLMHPDKRSNPAAVKAYMDAVHSGLDFTGAVDAARKQGGA